MQRWKTPRRIGGGRAVHSHELDILILGQRLWLTRKREIRRQRALSPDFVLYAAGKSIEGDGQVKNAFWMS